MKRVIKSSFGLKDADWVEPNNNESGTSYEDYLWLPIKRQTIHVMQNGVVEDEDMEVLLDRCVRPEYLKDDNYGFVIATEDEIDDLVENVVSDYVKENAKPNSDYVLSGRVIVHYSYWVSEPHVSGYGDAARYVRDDLRDYDPDSIQIDNVELSNVTLTRL